MAKVYKTAMGKTIDLDGLMAKNETSIAVGNTKTNARGDELGPGGRILRTRDQVMKEYYALKTPVAVDENLSNTITEQQKTARIPQAQGVAKDPIPEPPVVTEDSGLDADDMGEPETVVEEGSVQEEPQLRGKFADSVAKNVTITQKPLPNPKKAKGIRRF